MKERNDSISGSRYDQILLKQIFTLLMHNKNVDFVLNWLHKIHRIKINSITLTIIQALSSRSKSSNK